MDEELILLGKASSKMEAEIVKSFLESNGIPVFLRSSVAPYGDGPYMGFGGPVDVWIPKSYIEDALNLMQDIKGEKPYDTTEG
jgi:hypothetical protein